MGKGSMIGSQKEKQDVKCIFRVSDDTKVTGLLKGIGVLDG